MARSQDGVEVISMIDIILMKKDMPRCLQDLRSLRGMGGGLSNHQDVLCKVRVVGTWIKITWARRI